ncbi:hypothetical protein [Sediminibacterium sp.]|uniref:hypothetical protein n=1 Tax=Sediminibacterium sp. TaxID=1917865 RepID=UPI0025F5785B|nr:hypothetical protein [Sediminibacterium sp.]
MNSDQAIFIFTKDRPLVLKKTLEHLREITLPIFLIDDSLFAESNLANQSLLTANQFYLGVEEYRSFLYRMQVDPVKFSFLLRSPGRAEWNLGYMRNFAMLYARHKKIERILFMDDDIMVTNLENINTTLAWLDTYKLVGAEITGLVDDSILGHIATDLNIHNIRTLSGGFMAFNPSKTPHYFLNNYNEDWIWIFLNAVPHEIFMTGVVSQEFSDPMDNWEQKIFFQEFGEIALDGILELYECENKEEILQDSVFWERIVKERIEYIQLLYGLAEKVGNDKYTTILVLLRKDFAFAESFTKLFIEYFSNQRLLKPFLESF